MSRRAWVSDPLDRPVLVGVFAALCAVAFVVARLELMAHGDITRFIGVGSSFVRGPGLPRGVSITPGGGYDGEFYYRLALDPIDIRPSAFGITFDDAFRAQRVMYSAVVWAASLGHSQLVPDALVGVNVALLGGLAWLSAILARDLGRRPSAGLLIAGYFGFLFSLGRDLTEICEAFFLVGGLLALRRGCPVIAGALLAAAALSRETALGVAIAVGLVSVVEIVSGRRRPGRPDLAWVIPGSCFVAWQLYGRSVLGVFPVRADVGGNLTYPFVNMFGSIRHNLHAITDYHSLIWLGELAVITLVVVSAATALRRAPLRAYERTAWGIALVVVLCLSKGVWYGHADFRGFEDLFVLSAVTLLASDRRLGLLGVVVAVAFAVTFAHRAFLF